MKTLLIPLIRRRVVLACVMLSITLGGCVSTPQVTTKVTGPSGTLAYVSMCCACTDADTELLFLPDGQVKTLFSDRSNDRDLAWSPDGQWLGMRNAFVYGVAEQGLRIVNVTTEEVRWISREFIRQLAWTPDSQSLLYLDGEGDLYRYTLTSEVYEHITNEVEEFSLSSSGQWLGLSKRHPDHGYFTFQVIDLSTGDLFPELSPDDLPLWSGTSAWSPTADEVAVIWTQKNFSKIAVYKVYQNQLELLAESETARETYQRDYGEDLNSVEFYNLSWRPDGQLLVIRSSTDAKPGGEVLVFDESLSSYHRLPLEKNVTRLIWQPDGQLLVIQSSIDTKPAGEVLVFDENLSSYRRLTFGENVTQLIWLDEQWVVYVTGYDDDTCYISSRGEVWLANMNTLETKLLITNTLSIENPTWRP